MRPRDREKVATVPCAGSKRNLRTGYFFSIKTGRVHDIFHRSVHLLSYARTMRSP
jgi:hypothetical protein